MSFVEALRSALGNLAAHKLRSALTMLGMIFGVGAVIAMMSIGAGAEKQDQDDSDHDIHRRAGQRDQEFLARLFRHPLQPGDAADRQKRDIRRLDAVAAGSQHVAELMRHHAGK